MNEHSTKLTATWSQQDANASSKTQANVQKVAEARAKSDAARLTNFTTLESKATNDAQKQAVQTYEAAVRSAIANRRASYDVAKTTFHSAVQSAVAAKRANVTAQLTTFNASMNSARTTFQSGRTSDATVSATVKQLVATRNAAFQAADTAFHTAMTAAKAALATAFTKAV